jgi:hypothetical protein
MRIHKLQQTAGRKVSAFVELVVTLSLPNSAGLSKPVIYFRVQASSSHTEVHSHVGAPIIGNSTPHRRHPFVMTGLAAGLLKQEIAP